MALPPGSAAALADHSGFTYQLLEAAKGLSSGPPLEDPEEELELLLEELEELELLDELDELLEELEELDELELELDELELELELLEELELEELPSSPYSNTGTTGTGDTLPGVAVKPKLTWPPGAMAPL